MNAFKPFLFVLLLFNGTEQHVSLRCVLPLFFTVTAFLLLTLIVDFRIVRHLHWLAV